MSRWAETKRDTGRQSLLMHISGLLRLQASFDDLHATRTDLQSGLLGLLVTPQVR